MKRLVLTVAMAAALAACSGASSTPAGVAQEFMRKLSSGDCTGISSYLAASNQSIAPKLEQACTVQAAQKKNNPGQEKTLTSVNVLESTENGDRATVRLEGVFSDGSKEGGETLTLVREEGRWRVDLLAAKGSGRSGAGDGPAGPMAPPTEPPTALPTGPGEVPPPSADAPAMPNISAPAEPIVPNASGPAK